MQKNIGQILPDLLQNIQILHYFTEIILAGQNISAVSENQPDFSRKGIY
jgi:hypothetical protein